MTSLHVDRSEPVDGTVSLRWRGEAAAAAGGSAAETIVREIADEVLADPAVHRVEIRLARDDRDGRRIALRSGFRMEGVRRAVLPDGHGGWADEVGFSRLSGDVVGGPVGFSAVMNTALPRTRMIAHVLIRDPDGRVLFCETRFKPDWELPGGIVEVHEAPRLAAARELTEELGVHRPVGPLLAVDWMPPYLGWDDACELIFDGGLITERELDDLTLQPSEIAAVQLVGVEDAVAHLTPLAARRLRIITDLSPGETVLLEDGSRAEFG